nr:hypothetical protein [Tanacetum cinerariifolium]
ALATYEANHVAELTVESESQNGDDDNENVGGNGNRNGGENGDRNGRGNGNRNKKGNGNGNPNRNDRGVLPVARECTYHDFDRVEKFIGGLPDNIQGNVIADEPTRLQDVVRIANNLMDQKLKGYAVKNVENKRIFDNHQKDNRIQQPPYKRQNACGQSVARAYTTGNNVKRGYVGPLAYCNKSTFLLNNDYDSMLFDSGAHKSFEMIVVSEYCRMIDLCKLWESCMNSESEPLMPKISSSIGNLSHIRKQNTHEVVKGRLAKTPLEVLCLLLRSTSSCSEEPSKLEEMLHKLRTSLKPDGPEPVRNSSQISARIWGSNVCKVF